MPQHEIVLPQTKPETEWVAGRALQKVSPTYSHARLQTLLALALTQWADDGMHGRVATEWRFRVTPGDSITRPLVPDVAFLAYAALGADAPQESVEEPLAAPTVAVEILSPDDRQRDVSDKIQTYLAGGGAAVFIVDPPASRIDVHDRRAIVTYREGDTLTHAALPDFSLDIGALFKRARGRSTPETGWTELRRHRRGGSE